ncbi:ABC transporter permease [Psychrobacillus sp. NPDC096623]|uniref:ABC transporter permease n=1 Tax=Psychrobacillus sp. NPDC096623 TaxID=3364492 RepID=UPI00381C51B4
MNNFFIMFRKEWRENVRNFKILWIPLVFILFGISEPLTYYYLPQILNAVGNIPSDMAFQLPEYKPEQIIMSTIGQYQFIGLLIVAFGFAGIIARERKNGTGIMLYVRPISYFGYVFSKAAIMSILIIGSACIGLLANVYYTYILYGAVDGAAFIGFLGTYSIWLLFAISVVICSSAAFSTGVASVISIFILIVVQLVDSLLGTYWTISPWKLPMYAGQILSGNLDKVPFFWSLSVTLVLVVLLVIGAVYLAKRNVAKAKI